MAAFHSDPISLWALEGYPADATTSAAILKEIAPHMPGVQIRFEASAAASYGSAGGRWSRDPHATLVITHPYLLDGEATVARGEEIFNLLNAVKQ